MTRCARLAELTAAPRLAGLTCTKFLTKKPVTSRITCVLWLAQWMATEPVIVVVEVVNSPIPTLDRSPPSGCRRDPGARAGHRAAG